MSMFKAVTAVHWIFNCNVYVLYDYTTYYLW